MESKTPITCLKQIDTTTNEGLLLVAAIGKIQAKLLPTTPSEDIINGLNKLANKIFDDNKGRNINDPRPRH